MFPNDVGDDNILRIFVKGRIWRTVALGKSSSLALSRWLGILPFGRHLFGLA